MIDYTHSSYVDYMRDDSSLVDIYDIYRIVDKESFIKFNNEIKTDICMDVADDIGRLNDTDGLAIMQSVSNCSNSSEFQSLETTRRDLYIKALKQKGLSIRQISRLTGISFGIVRKL
jgi:hypothetical protein